jgi:hypothetical protein
MRAVDESWMLEDFTGGDGTKPFSNELVQFATDGSGKVRRLLHHRSIVAAYYDEPRPNISMDGRFIAFTSNWGGQARTDLYIARITLVPPVPPITPTPPTPAKRKVAWPSQEGKQDQVMESQRVEGYYPAKNLNGAWMEFWKVS